MNSPGLIALVFLAGLGAGWFGKTWFESYQLKFGTIVTSATGGNHGTAAPGDAQSTNANLTPQSELSRSREANPGFDNTQDNVSQLDRQGLTEDTTGISILDTFIQLLEDRRYFDAMTLFQEQKTQSEQNAAQLKVTLLDELEHLIEVRNNSDFSELVEQYLSIYYDDIDVLLLLAEFNQANGSYW